MNKLKVIALCPLYKTGGPEALHQLIHVIREESLADAYIHYTGNQDSKADQIKRHYQSLYNIKEISAHDIKGNILVFPEVFDPQLALSFGAKHNWVWWLGFNKIFPTSSYAGIGNLCQSEHAASFIRLLNGKYILLTDFINLFYKDKIDPIPAKENIIVYGPKSVYDVFRIQLIDFDLKLIPLIGLNSHQIRDLLYRAKVYIDFGWHAGRDRMPREAALCNCIVVTNKLGAANNDIDIPVDPIFKLNSLEIDKNTLTIKNFMMDYERLIPMFDTYKNWVKLDKDRFINETKNFVLCCENESDYTFNTIDVNLDKQLLLIQSEFQNYRVNWNNQIFYSIANLATKSYTKFFLKIYKNIKSKFKKIAQ